jgi:excisionase family DNA binding protein
VTTTPRSGHPRLTPRQPFQPPPPMLRTGEVADLLHVSPKTVARWAAEGRLPFQLTLGGHRRYPAADMRALAEELRHDAEQERAGS